MPAIRWSTLKDAADEEVHRLVFEADRDVLLMKRDYLHNS